MSVWAHVRVRSPTMGLDSIRWQSTSGTPSGAFPYATDPENAYEVPVSAVLQSTSSSFRITVRYVGGTTAAVQLSPSRVSSRLRTAPIRRSRSRAQPPGRYGQLGLWCLRRRPPAQGHHPVARGVGRGRPRRYFTFGDLRVGDLAGPLHYARRDVYSEGPSGAAGPRGRGTWGQASGRAGRARARLAQRARGEGASADRRGRSAGRLRGRRTRPQRPHLSDCPAPAGAVRPAPRRCERPSLETGGRIRCGRKERRAP